MAVCPKCKKTLVEKVKSCPSCGTDVSEIISQTSKEEKEKIKSNVGCFVFIILILCWVGYSLVSCSIRSNRKEQQLKLKEQELQQKIPVLESELTKAMKTDTYHISDADINISVTEGGKYSNTCDLYFRSSIPDYVITPYCKSLCEKSFTDYPDISYPTIRIRGFKNRKLVGGYTPLGELF